MEKLEFCSLLTDKVFIRATVIYIFANTSREFCLEAVIRYDTVFIHNQHVFITTRIFFPFCRAKLCLNFSWLIRHCYIEFVNILKEYFWKTDLPKHYYYCHECLCGTHCKYYAYFYQLLNSPKLRVAVLESFKDWQAGVLWLKALIDKIFPSLRYKVHQMINLKTCPRVWNDILQHLFLRIQCDLDGETFPKRLPFSSGNTVTTSSSCMQV